VVWLLPPVPRSGPDSADRACATKASGPARFPCSVRPARIRPAQPAPRHHAEHPASRAREEPSAGTSELHAWAAANARGSRMAVHAPRAAGRPPQRPPPAERQPHAVPPRFPHRGRWDHATPAAPGRPCPRISGNPSTRL